MQRRRAPSARLPRLLRGQPRNGVDRATVHLDLEMEVLPGRQAGRSNLAYHLARDHPRRGRHDRRREVAIEHTDVAVDGNGHVEAGAARVESHTDRAAGRGTDGGALWSRETVSYTHVPARTVGIEGLEDEVGAAERLRHD